MMDISCSFVEMFEKRQKKRKIRNKILIIFLCLFLVLLIIFFYYYFVIKSVVVDFTKASVNKMVTSSVNSAITSLINDNIINFDNIVTIEKDNSNEANTLLINSLIVNKISNNLAIKTQELLNKQTQFGVEIPIGTLSGLFFLNGRGENINFSCTPVGEVECDFNSEFEDAGINQTIHKFYIEIKSKVNVNLPIKNYVVNNINTFLVAETIIVGNVPTVYIK